MGIAIHNLSGSGEGVGEGNDDLAAAVRQAAFGILGTSVQLADLVRVLFLCGHLWISVDIWKRNSDDGIGVGIEKGERG